MSRLQNLTPDVVLRKHLEGKVRVRTDEEEWRDVKVYADGERPNSKLGKELIELTWNGAAESLTQPIGLYRGNLALVVWVKSQPDGRVKTQLVRQIIGQIEDLVNGIHKEGFHFNFDSTSVIMPTNSNIESGYSTTVLNVAWHVTDDFF